MFMENKIENPQNFPLELFIATKDSNTAVDIIISYEFDGGDIITGNIASGQVRY